MRQTNATLSCVVLIWTNTDILYVLFCFLLFRLRQQYVCTYLVTTISRCRQLTADGEAFNKCSYASRDDRIADIGPNASYPLTLDTYHEFYTNNYNCPVNRINDLQCSSINNNQVSLIPSNLLILSNFHALTD